MSKLARLSLANRSVIALATIAIMIFGGLITPSLRQELIPSLELPVAAVATAYPGASPEVVEREVTEPIENAVKGIAGLESVTSTSSSGFSTVQVSFTYGIDIKSAVQEIEQAVGRLGPRLPADVDPSVQAGRFDDFPVVILAASSALDQQRLADQLEKTVIPELTAIDGVRDARVAGVRDKEIAIRLDLGKVLKAGLTPSGVTNALQANGVVLPGGTLTEGGRTLAIDAGRSYASIDELRNLTLAPAPSPALAIPGLAAPKPAKAVKLSDVADIDVREATARALTRTNGQPTLGIQVVKAADASTVAISDAVHAKLGDLRTAMGNGADLTVVFDQAPFIKDSIHGLTTEGLLGLAFAVLVILLFLFSFRSTIVTAVSIPLSLLIAMIGLYVSDYSLNILTLGALTIAVGRVVDDSIVVLENIKRHLGYGERRRDAVLTGTKEVTGAITASTITTVAVFLPIAFVGGQVGELFRPFAVTIAIALLASLLVSLTIIPVLAYWFLKPSTGVDRTAAEERERNGIMQRTYVPIINWAVRRKALTLALGMLVFIGTIALTPALKTNFIDSSGQNTLSVTQTLPPGTDLATTDAAARKVEQAIGALTEIETYQVTVGSTGSALLGAGGGNQARFSISTDPDADQAAFKDRLRRVLDGLTDVGEVKVAGQQSGFGGSSLEVLVQAPDEKVLRSATQMVTDMVRGIEGAADVTNDLEAAEPGVEVVPDRTKAAKAGLSDAQIGQAVQQSVSGSRRPILVGGETYSLVIRGGIIPLTVKDLKGLNIATPTGKTVRITDVATVREVDRPTRLTRIDGARSAKVTASPSADDLGRINTALTAKLAELKLPAGAKAVIGGVSADQQEAFGQLGLALVAAVAIVFAVMVATFGSLIQPLILLVSVPFAATGALGLLLATDTPLGVPAIIGLLMLVGIVVTNAIVLIDLINQYRSAGLGVREAVVEGARHRLRPILMTAVATICALFPMSLGLTGGGVFISQPLAVVVIGGLISSTLLTLVLVPTLYTLVEEFKERRKSRRGRRSVTPREEREVQPVG
ncbi:efflux RND transporter permease subunit [Rhizohabitans arisaemae]|uniref:efflux RND transporter permease subunit n=1 Tax=Rhizohabitans arisaemae TaxID=2720610 RepID=UPI0024B28001|nr:efflux RND transporter permease subunit [Rhizohabitans arisaemae]